MVAMTTVPCNLVLIFYYVYYTSCRQNTDFLKSSFAFNIYNSNIIHLHHREPLAAYTAFQKKKKNVKNNLYRTSWKKPATHCSVFAINIYNVLSALYLPLFIIIYNKCSHVLKCRTTIFNSGSKKLKIYFQLHDIHINLDISGKKS